MLRRSKIGNFGSIKVQTTNFEVITKGWFVGLQWHSDSTAVLIQQLLIDIKTKHIRCMFTV